MLGYRHATEKNTEKEGQEKEEGRKKRKKKRRNKKARLSREREEGKGCNGLEDTLRYVLRDSMHQLDSPVHRVSCRFDLGEMSKDGGDGSLDGAGVVGREKVSEREVLDHREVCFQGLEGWL